MLRELKLNYQCYLMLLPAIVLLFIFAYIPMPGIYMSFVNYRPILGIFGSPWVGLEHFRNFFNLDLANRTIKNTLILSSLSLLITFPAPILLAILLSEVKNKFSKRIYQTVSYLPYFISSVVVCGMLRQFLAYDGWIVHFLHNVFGMKQQNLLGISSAFRSIFIISDLWQYVGWNSIIYLAAISALDLQLFDAAKIDGANKIQQILHVTLPGIVPTASILLIFSLGGLLTSNTEKILLLYSPIIYETSDVIGTYVYRMGIEGSQYSFATAIGLFQTLVNVVLLVGANQLSRKLTENSLW